MSFQRRASAFDLGRRMDARFMARAGGGPPPFSYDDIPNQLLRINSLEGSLAFSGAVLTGVTDVSPVGGTVNVTGSPVYTAVDAGLNGAPSFTIAAASSVIAPNVDRASVRFTVAVMYRALLTQQYAFDGIVAPGRIYASFNTNGRVVANISLAVPTGEPVVGRKIFVAPNDGITQVRWNPSAFGTWEPIGVQPIGTGSGNGITIGAGNTGTLFGLRTALFMQCSSVPSAPLLAALEAKLITDFG